MCTDTTDFFCDKLKATCLPRQTTKLVEFMCKDTFVCIYYGICLSNE